MNMKWYWAKIGLTAGAIFLVGYSVLGAFKATKRQVVNVVEGSGDVTIPLVLVPFNFDGTKLGTFRKLVIHRSGPEEVSGVDVTVRLTDLAAVERLAGCHLTVDDPTRLNEHSSFRCVSMDSTMEGFGSMVIQTKDSSGDWVVSTTVPLALPIEVAKRIRGAKPESAFLAVETDRFKEIGDSLGVLGRQLGRATSDSARDAIEAQMSDLRDQMEELQSAIQEAAQARAEAAVERVRVRVDRRAPRPPEVPPPPGN